MEWFDEDGKFYEAAVKKLVEYGRAVWRDGRKLNDGGSEGDHNASAAKQWAALGRHDLAKKSRPAYPPFPFEVEYLWNLFAEFSWGLKSTGMGPATASWGDVRDFSDVCGHDLRPVETSALVRLAAERATVLAEGIKKEMKT